MALTTRRGRISAMTNPASPSVVARAPRPRGAAPAPRFPGAPDVTLPLRFLLFGLACLFLGVGLLVARPDLLATYHYNQHIVAVTHLFVLGFVLSVVMGALYQLAPVALETQLASERLARWHFPVHVVSVAGMVWMFWVWDMKQVGHFGSGLALGVGLFVWNLVRTLRRVRGWTVVSFGIASCLGWLVAVLVAGLAVAAAKSTYELVGRADVFRPLAVTLAGLKATADFLSHFEPLAVMHAHAHLGIAGVFVVLTTSVAYKLVPMFLIADVQNPRRAWASIWMLNVGLGAVFLAILRQSAWKPVAALVLVAGLVLYGLELGAIVRARRRRALDWGLRGFLTAQALLGPTALLGWWLSRPSTVLDDFTGRLENAYGVLAVLGVIAFSIVGMLHKIVPFLVWFAAYSREVGRARTPALHEMYSARVQAVGFWLWVGGLGLLLTGILLASAPLNRAGACLLAGSLVALAFNTAGVLSHLVRPRLEPLAFAGRAPFASL